MPRPNWEEQFKNWQQEHADSTWQGYFHESFQKPLEDFIRQTISQALDEVEKRVPSDVAPVEFKDAIRQVKEKYL